MKLPNHYETLNVAASASPEEIRASYISLCKMFHETQELIDELTVSYEILKNPATKAEYDRRVQELLSGNETILPPPAPVELKVSASVSRINIDQIIAERIQQREAYQKESNSWSSKVASIAAGLAIVGLVCIGIASNKSMFSRLSFMGLNDFLESKNYVRPTTAPNGQAFPEASGYISGYEVKKNEGHTSLLVDNSRNDHDVYLKLLSVENNTATVVRHVYVKAKSDFKLENIAGGTYEIRYLDLVAGLGGKSETFNVREQKAEENTVTGLKVVLKTAINGTLRVDSVSVEEFNSLASL